MEHTLVLKCDYTISAYYIFQIHALTYPCYRFVATELSPKVDVLIIYLPQQAGQVILIFPVPENGTKEGKFKGLLIIIINIIFIQFQFIFYINATNRCPYMELVIQKITLKQCRQMFLSNRITTCRCLFIILV